MIYTAILEKTVPHPSSLKQTLLLFDQVGLPALGRFLEYSQNNPAPSKDFIQVIDYLKSNGWLIDAFSEEMVINDDFIAPAIIEEVERILDIPKEVSLIGSINQDSWPAFEAVFKERISKLPRQEWIRMICSVLNIRYKNEATYTPLVTGPLRPMGMDKNSDIVKIVLTKLPIPESNTPWAKIFEFKQNGDNKGQIALLRNWMHGALRSGRPSNEINDELDGLLFQYRKSLELHKIKHTTGKIEGLVVGAAEIMENAMRLRFSHIAKALFKVSADRVSLMEAELNSPGNEVAYIYKAQQTFTK